MRWVVELPAPSGGTAATVTVDADSWAGALTRARGGTAIKKFKCEFEGDGVVRVLDLESRNRFTIRPLRVSDSVRPPEAEAAKPANAEAPKPADTQPVEAAKPVEAAHKSLKRLTGAFALAIMFNSITSALQLPLDDEYRAVLTLPSSTET